ncbi:hypothetical protein [Evansella clarkii]|uniref:hypothetical protein n=1 Tax=Evansella clarkii TaxID=79879 RepID=UPI000998B199|nr:hypothetical protein [Evansella clarkii]
MITNYEYNINGIGIINPEIYGTACELLEDSNLKIINKLKGINQLGAIRYIHNGAHYTRFEYVLLQVMLINFLKDHGKMGLNSKKDYWKFFVDDGTNYKKKKITGTELLQLTVILGNMGYSKDTFSSNKVWYHYLKLNKANVKTLFKNGLKKESKKLFDVILDTNDFQKIHWLNTLFILSRKSEYDECREICELILNNILSNNPNYYIDLHTKVRRVSYIVMDSHFSHIPISIDLKSVLFNRELFIDEIEKKISGLMEVFNRMNSLLEDTLYLENNAILIGSKRSLDLANKLDNYLEENRSQNNSLKLIQGILMNEDSPFNKEENFSYNTLPWDKDTTLSITYFVKDRKGFPEDIFKEELDKINYLGSKCHIGIGFSPDYLKYRTVYALDKKISNNIKVKNCLKIIYNALGDYFRFKRFAKSEVNNGEFTEVVTKKVITYLFRNILKEDYFCEFNYEGLSDALIISNGNTNAVKKVEEHLSQFKRRFPENKDGMHEIFTVIKALEKITYRGLYVIYTGSLKFIDENKQSVCELDGIIFTPYNRDFFLKVVEAKRISNKHQRSKVALDQLNEKFTPLINVEIIENIKTNEINSYGAEISIT